MGLKGDWPDLEGGHSGLKGERPGFGDGVGFEISSLVPPELFLPESKGEFLYPLRWEPPSPGDSACFSADITSDIRTLM